MMLIAKYFLHLADYSSARGTYGVYLIFENS